MKTKKIIIILILVSLIIYCTIKGILLYKYPNHPYLTQEYLNKIQINDTITIKTNLSNEYSDYFKLLENVKIKNNFNDFNLLVNSNVDSNNQIRIYTRNIYDYKETIIISKSNDRISDLKKSTISTQVTVKDTINFLNKYNITTDIELHKYINSITNIKEIQNSIFTSIFKIKENYIKQIILGLQYEDLDKFTLIEGDYSGLMMHTTENNDSTIVSLYKDNVKYYIGFSPKKVYTPEYIEELISTIVIE